VRHDDFIGGKYRTHLRPDRLLGPPSLFSHG
jgi:hypothetical protein